jgi:hypothetical protein
MGNGELDRLANGISPLETLRASEAMPQAIRAYRNQVRLRGLIILQPAQAGFDSVVAVSTAI